LVDCDLGQCAGVLACHKFAPYLFKARCDRPQLHKQLVDNVRLKFNGPRMGRTEVALKQPVANIRPLCVTECIPTAGHFLCGIIGRQEVIPASCLQKERCRYPPKASSGTTKHYLTGPTGTRRREMDY
jgi:hypothetical protein